MANLRTNNLSGEQGQNAIRGSVTFGGYVDGVASDYLSVADNDDLDMGTGDFTFECWLLATEHVGPNTPNPMGIISSQSWTAGGILIQVRGADDPSGVLRVVVPLSGGGYLDVNGSTNFYNEQGRDWVHIAVVRTSGTLKGYVNGIEEISTSYSVGVDFAHGGTCTIGENGYDQYPGDYPFRGNISNLRLTKGLARYTSTFTPPAFELTADADTVLLCCQDSDNPFQEETGKTITGFGRYYPDTGELFTDTGFNTTNAWTGAGSNGWTVSGDGVATHAQGTAGDLFQQISNLVVGQTYKLQVDVVTSDDDVAYFYVDNNPGGSYPALGNASNARVGHYELYFRANATSMYIGFRGSSLFAGTITNLRLQSYGIGLNPKMPEIIPPYGVDAGNTFGGSIKQSTEGYMYFPTGGTEERGRGRGVLSGGRNDHAMQFVNIQSQGNSQTFGDSITGDGIEGFAVGSSTRGLFSGGYPSVGNVIEFITFATTSNGKDFGDMTTGRRSGAGAGNETRGLFGGGLNSSGTTLNTIEFSTIASLGNSTDFGDMTQARDQLAGLSDTTRAIFAGGVEQGGSQHNIMDFVTIATTGNAQDFGDTSAINHGSSASSDSTRGVIALAYTAPNMINTIEFITIQSAGNSKDFGDLTQAGYLSANMSNSTRSVIAGRGTPSASNTIDFVTIQTTGNANDFGDLIGGANFVVVGTSDSHGGLS